MSHRYIRGHDRIVCRLCQVGAAFVTATALLSGCAELTEVDPSDIVQPEAVDNAIGAEALRAGAITRFTNGFAGGEFDGSYVATTGLMADEFFSRFNNRDNDKRTEPDPSFSSGAITSGFYSARMNARQAIQTLQRVAPEPRSRIGELFAITAYTELFFGESFCSGVPLSGIEDGQPVFGQPLTTVEMLERSLVDFDSALAYATDIDEISDLARVGRARAFLNLGRFADAAAEMAAVPTGFSYTTEHYSTAVQPNGIYLGNRVGFFFTISEREGINGLDFRSANDPRVQTEYVGGAEAGRDSTFALTNKYTSVTSPVVLASGVEARLIEAEALLQAGNASGALGKLNALRTTIPGLAPLPLRPTQEERIDQLFRERAFWLFATGHRHGDLRRLIRQYGRTEDEVFPTGPYRAGAVYGDEVTLTLPPGELNNPNYNGCLSREA